MKVIIRGSVTVYAPQGKYQIECSQIVPKELVTFTLLTNNSSVIWSKKDIFHRKGKGNTSFADESWDFYFTDRCGSSGYDIHYPKKISSCSDYFQPTLVRVTALQRILHVLSGKLNEYDPDVIIIGRGGGSLEICGPIIQK